MAVRIVVERERERMAFVSAGYWSLTSRSLPTTAPATTTGVQGRACRLDGLRVATGRDFDSDGTTANGDIAVLDEAAAGSLASELDGAAFAVRSRRAKPYRRRPAPPFITSTLQQEAARKLSMSSAAAMRAAQSLYEKGYISYMRTDSTSLSSSALTAGPVRAARRFGEASLPPQPRVYASKVKNAQEAHEAIRPAGDSFPDPETVAKQVPRPEARLYELVWKRTVASQMVDCTGQTVQLRIGTHAGAVRDAVFAASGTVISDLGFRKVYTEGTDAGDSTDSESELRLPPVREGDPAHSLAMEAAGHSTQPPPRYTEASLVRRLEQLGVGRPSTYSSIMGTITDRGYVWRQGTALVPSFTGVLGGEPARAALPEARSTTPSPRRWRTTDRIATGPRRPCRGSVVSTSGRRRPRIEGEGVEPSRRHRRPRRELDPPRRRRRRRGR